MLLRAADILIMTSYKMNAGCVILRRPDKPTYGTRHSGHSGEPEADHRGRAVLGKPGHEHGTMT